MNVSLTPTAEALLQQLNELGYDNPASVIEQALQYFHSQQQIDTTLGFPERSEAEIIQENEARWQAFQQNLAGIPQAQVEAWFASYNNPS
jgi:hypothetical protein